MKLQLNKYGNYTAKSKLFKDFWLLKCHLVENRNKSILSVNQEMEVYFNINKKHLKLFPNYLQSRGWYGTAKDIEPPPEYTTIQIDILIEENGIKFNLHCYINIDNGKVELYFSPVGINTKTFIAPKGFGQEKIVQIIKQKIKYSKEEKYIFLHDEDEMLLEDLIRKIYLKKFEVWLDYLSKLPREMNSLCDPSICIGRHKMRLIGVCRELLNPQNENIFKIVV